jgi:Bacterial lectin/F5/8 type C domain
MKIWLTLILTIVLFVGNCYGQFQTNNDAAALGGDTYMLTPDDFNKAGSLWYKLQHDLTLPFNVQGRLYFGSNDGGADGIAFVMQNNCLNAGTAGGGIGYAGMPGKSIAVEFDTYENTTPATGSFNNNDPAYDHVAVEKMGNVNHANVDSNLFGPIQAHPTKTNIEDNVWYDFQISYNPITHDLRVFFDNTLRFTYNYDILTNIFNGDPYIYWGFTSSTGGSKNYQAVYINKNLSTYTLTDAIICGGQTVSVTLPPLSRFYGKNIALSKTAVSAPGFISNASEAIDGNVNSRWESQQGIDPQWMYVDLGASYDLDSVIFHWEAAYAAQFELQVSTNATAWSTVYTETNTTRLSSYPATNLKDTVVATAANIRYVRMLGTARATGYGYSLWEFQIYAKPKYIWSPDDGSIDDIYSETPTFTPTATTTYTVLAPDPCSGAVAYNMTITVDCALPVELMSFEVIKIGNKGHVTWTTSLEENTSHFTVMRSLDGINFIPIGKTGAANQSHSLRSYYFDDLELPTNGSVYYQLTTTDLDGSSSNSMIRVLNIKEESAYISNTVFDEETSLVLLSETKSLQLTVVDALGRILSEEYHTNVTTSPIPFGKSLPPTAGFYVVIVQTETFNKTFTVVKRKVR